jgi:hypothetical protein
MFSKEHGSIASLPLFNLTRREKKKFSRSKKAQFLSATNANIHVRYAMLTNRNYIVRGPSYGPRRGFVKRVEESWQSEGCGLGEDRAWIYSDVLRRRAPQVGRYILALVEGWETELAGCA